MVGTVWVSEIDVNSDCVDDDEAAVALASMWDPSITGCEDAIPYLTEAGYPCDTDLSVLGMSGTIADICECTCLELNPDENPLLGNWYSDDINGETEYVSITENTLTIFGFNSDFNCFEDISLDYIYIGEGIISVIDPEYGTIEISAIILENGDLQIINPAGDTLQFSSIEEIPSDLVMCSYGCTDPDAINYNPESSIDDDSCEYDEDCIDDNTTAAEYFGDFFLTDCSAIINYLQLNYGYSQEQACDWNGVPMINLDGLLISDICECSCNINNTSINQHNLDKTPLFFINLLGEVVRNPISNKPLFIIFNDGSVQKTIITN